MGVFVPTIPLYRDFHYISDATRLQGQTFRIEKVTGVTVYIISLAIEGRAYILSCFEI
jgi:hypothetical protein